MFKNWKGKTKGCSFYFISPVSSVLYFLRFLFLPLCQHQGTNSATGCFCCFLFVSLQKEGVKTLTGSKNIFFSRTVGKKTEGTATGLRCSSTVAVQTQLHSNAGKVFHKLRASFSVVTHGVTSMPRCDSNFLYPFVHK